jgi:hypothetical protein
MTGTQVRSIPRSIWQQKAGFKRLPNQQQEEEESTLQNEGDTDNEFYDTVDGADDIKERNKAERSLGSSEDDQDHQYITRSGRIIRRPKRLEYMAFESLLLPYDHDDWSEWCEQELFAFKASTDPDTMYYHQAMREPDKERFQEAIRKECEAHFKESNYKLIPRSEVLQGAPLLSSVWQMKRKRKPSTGEISKYKARMNVNGKEQIKGIHYEETYAPVFRPTAQLSPMHHNLFTINY